MNAGAETKELVACPVCGGRRLKRYGTRGEYNLVTCRACGLVFVREKMPPGFFEQYYRGQSCECYARREAELRLKFQRVLDRVQELGPPARKALDVGCGSGIFLEVARERGVEALGIEADPSRAEWCIARGLSVIQGYLPDPRLQSGSFDLVCLSHILEHIHTPREFLREVTRLMSPGGVLCVLVPNAKSIAARICRCHHHYVIPPEHLTYWSARPLCLLMNQMGLVPKLVFTSGGRLQVKEILAHILKLRFLRKPAAKASATRFVSGKGRFVRLLYGALLNVDRLTSPVTQFLGGEELVGFFLKPVKDRGTKAP